ncbi:MAG TPA: hypothetical protein PLB27_15430 [Bacteroidales bacterium]|nr:hypothetical protein [Bacteroidales bacterium]
MTTLTKKEKLGFFTRWTLLSFGIIPVSYMVSLIIVLLVHGVFGFSQMEGGTYLSQTVMQVAGGAVIGLGAGLYQKSLLKKVFKVSWAWIYACMVGFAVTELIVCLILWRMNINRYELRFIESNPLPEALFFACAGLLTGFLQWPLLRRYFLRSIYWVPASTLGWGICILITYFTGMVLKGGLSILTFIFGALLYGLITGGTLMWVLRERVL